MEAGPGRSEGRPAGRGVLRARAAWTRAVEGSSVGGAGAGCVGTGWPFADTPSRPTPPDKPPRTCAPPTDRPPPPRALHDQGRALPESQRRTHEATLRAVLPEYGVRAGVTATRTDALVATLAQAEQAGHDPEALLRQAINMRELDTAEDVNDVLVWRLRRIAQLPAHPGEAPPRPQAGTHQAKTSTSRTSERSAPAAAPRPAVPDHNRRPPRR
ncbi:hypothetical protein [Streptomyces sp. NPDC055681]